MKNYVIAVDHKASFNRAYDYHNLEAENEIDAIIKIQNMMPCLEEVYLVKLLKKSRKQNCYNPILNIRSNNSVEWCDVTEVWSLHPIQFRNTPKINYCPIK